MIGPTDLLHPSPAPHFKTFQVFLICCPKRPSIHFLNISRSFLLRMRNVSDKSCRENPHILCSMTFFARNSCRLRYNVGKYCRIGQAADDSIIRRMRTACWITKSTRTCLCGTLCLHCPPCSCCKWYVFPVFKHAFLRGVLLIYDSCSKNYLYCNCWLSFSL